ncbi:MAG TPA: alcohol dehydrogenase catalytic domain-containing protein, partial [Pyrinomonadaceae bacterium]|nr:alcohol dehydrogenase catalytic domain-containing protein [Pyrinomonadaceae bacterium]
MKACVLDAPAPVGERPLRFAEVPAPSQREDELLVRVSACGVCRTDLHVVEGELPRRLSPVIPGHQIVGRVAEVGARVKEFKKGERVGVAWLN